MWRIYLWFENRVVEPLCAIHLLTHFYQLSPHYTLQMPSPNSFLCCLGQEEVGQYGEKQTLQEQEFTPGLGIPPYILHGIFWFAIIFPFYNTCYASKQISVSVLDSTLSDLIIVENMDKDKLCATFMFLDAADPSHTPIILQTFTRFMISATESPQLVLCPSGA